MITYLRVDNFRSLVNFEWRPGSICLLAGTNGAGKSSVLTILRTIRHIVTGGRLPDCIDPEDLTWWQRRDELSVRLEMRAPDAQTLTYELIVKFGRNRELPLIHSERLSEGERPLFDYSGRTVHLYDDESQKRGEFAFGSSRSFIAEIVSSPVNRKLSWFRDYWSRALVIKPDINRLSSHSADEENTLRADATNFASWWRYTALSQPSAIARLEARLPELIPGAQALRFADLGNGRSLVLDIRRGGHTRAISLQSLTEGQRTLILLYAIADSLEPGQFVTLDEALNYIAIPEVQPALVALREAAEDKGAQLFVVSHHPEVVNYLGADDVYLFTLKDGLSQCRPLKEIELHGARLSDYLAVSGDAL